MAIIKNIIREIIIESKNIKIPEIITTEFGPIPKTVYKYLNIDASNCEVNLCRLSLDKQYAWFSNPLSFNDPFDCSIQWANYKLAEDDTKFIDYYTQIESIRHRHLTQKEVETRVLNQLQFSKANPEFLKNYHLGEGKVFLENLVSKIGMYSTCLENDNILLWSHYGNKHTGICIGLDTYKFLKKYPELQYDYVKYIDYPVIEPFNYYDHILAREAAKIMLLTKAPFWDYEVEYRFIELEAKNRDKNISDLIESITFGMKILPLDRDYALNACKAMNPNISVFEARAVPFSYELEIISV